MKYQYPFGEYVQPVVQQDKTMKKVFVLGVYASAVHARWVKDRKTICQALAVASEPEIFWDGNQNETRVIIGRIQIPDELGRLEPADRHFNGPSARVLDADILAPLGFTRSEVWLCDCLPETRLNANQFKVIEEKYNPFIERYGLNRVTIPRRPGIFCDDRRVEEITAELMKSQADLLILLGDIPIAQYMQRVSNISYSGIQEYVSLFGYGNPSEAEVGGRKMLVLPLAHPRQIGALGTHSGKWYRIHQEWERKKV